MTFNMVNVELTLDNCVNVANLSLRALSIISIKYMYIWFEDTSVNKSKTFLNWQIKRWWKHASRLKYVSINFDISISFDVFMYLDNFFFSLRFLTCVSSVTTWAVLNQSRVEWKRPSRGKLVWKAEYSFTNWRKRKRRKLSNLDCFRLCHPRNLVYVLKSFVGEWK